MQPLIGIALAMLLSWALVSLKAAPSHLDQ
jgi:hypothetical protein